MASPLEFSSTQLNAWIGAYAWPFARIAALVGAAPLFGTRTVPVRVRLGIALALTAAVAPVLPALAELEPLSLASLNVTVQQVLIGLGLGFALRLAFAALELAGEAIGQAMGLGFASLVDPQNGTPVPAVSQFYTLMATLLFFAFNGHWTMIEILVESFRSFPVGASVASAAWADLAALGAQLFAGALAIALPILTALLLVNLAFGVMARAAPQLNLFAVGFPLTLAFGLVMMLFTLPLLQGQWTGLLEGTFGAMRALIGTR